MVLVGVGTEERSASLSGGRTALTATEGIGIRRAGKPLPGLPLLREAGPSVRVGSFPWSGASRVGKSTIRAGVSSGTSRERRPIVCGDRPGTVSDGRDHLPPEADTLHDILRTTFHGGDAVPNGRRRAAPADGLRPDGPVWTDRPAPQVRGLPSPTNGLSPDRSATAGRFSPGIPVRGRPRFGRRPLALNAHESTRARTFRHCSRSAAGVPHGGAVVRRLSDPTPHPTVRRPVRLMVCPVSSTAHD
jgi:hypothetical protein